MPPKRATVQKALAQQAPAQTATAKKKPTKRAPTKKAPTKKATKASTSGSTPSPKGVQKHGKKWENAIITVMVSPKDLHSALHQSHTAIHDLPKFLNKVNPAMNVSIKATHNKTVYFGDARRIIHSLRKPNSPLEAIVVKYKQSGTQKVPKSVVHINMTKGKKELLGTLPDKVLDAKVAELDAMVKADQDFKPTARALQKLMRDSGAALTLAPKKANKSAKRAGRLQFTIPNIDKFAAAHPRLVTENTDCKIYGNACLLTLESAQRVMKKKTAAAGPAPTPAATKGKSKAKKGGRSTRKNKY